MADKIRVWLDQDRTTIHHADASVIGGMETRSAQGETDCGLAGTLKPVHHENVDMGKLCDGCRAVSGVRPALAGQDLGPV